MDNSKTRQNGGPAHTQQCLQYNDSNSIAK